MRRLLAAMVASGALALSTVTGSAPASAAPVGPAELLSVGDVSSVYPTLVGADRLRSTSGITAPRAVVKAGVTRCDRYRSIRGTSRREVLFFDAVEEESVALGQHVVRMRSVGDATAVLRHYRGYVRTCEGRHATTDGEGGRAGMVVRGWSPPRVGDASVGLLVAFAQHGLTTWRRTLVVRVGATITLQELEPYSGKGSADRLVELSHLAAARLPG